MAKGLAGVRQNRLARAQASCATARNNFFRYEKKEIEMRVAVIRSLESRQEKEATEKTAKYCFYF
jgi:hypothetical protein